MTSGIYRIELGNGWFYIGSAHNIRKREREHCRGLERKDHCNDKMQNCFNKYGVFKLTILEECATEDLIIREQTYLDKHFDDKKNVNIAPTANSCLGRVVSAEHRAKISNANRGKICSAETRAKLSKAGKGRVFSTEHRAKLSEATKNISDEVRAKKSAAQKGRVVSAETRAKISAANRHKIQSPQHRQKISAGVKAYHLRKAQAA